MAGLFSLVEKCGCERKHLAWLQVGEMANTMRQLRYQCPDCGMVSGQALPHRLANANTPTVDVAKLRAWEERQEQFWSDRGAVVAARAQIRREQWRTEYEDYIQSDAWHNKRRLVFARARNTCEGCGVNRATQVHHLSYAHMGHEFLWELVAICDACHARVHNAERE